MRNHRNCCIIINIIRSRTDRGSDTISTSSINGTPVVSWPAHLSRARYLSIFPERQKKKTVPKTMESHKSHPMAMTTMNSHTRIPRGKSIYFSLKNCKRLVIYRFGNVSFGFVVGVGARLFPLSLLHNIIQTTNTTINNSKYCLRDECLCVK